MVPDPNRQGGSQPFRQATCRSTNGIRQYLRDRLDAHLGNARRVLDIGAGEGYLARLVHGRIAGHGLSTVLEACDLFPENFRVPAMRCHGIDLHCGLPFPTASVDLAYSVEVIEHLEDQFEFVREAHRVLRPGGRLIVTTPNVLSLTSRLRTLFVGFPELFGPLPLGSSDPQHVGGHIHPVSIYYLAYIAEKIGFRVAACHIDRVKSSAVAALVLWPLIAFATRYARAGMRRRSASTVAENVAHLAAVNSFRVLTGRTITLELVKQDTPLPLTR